MKILLTGPTAVGKSSVSIELARRINAEIISSDSRQCYKYMNIGTATPDEKERGGIPHYNLSIIDPFQKDSAVKFYHRALQWEKEIIQHEHTILYVGGSTLHQQIIIQPFDELPDADEQNIALLEKQIEQKGIESLFKDLIKADPEYASQMDGMNPQRIIRALDVWMQTGRPFSSFHANGPVSPPDDLKIVGLRRDRNELYQRINRRVDRMFEEGFLDEVQSLRDKGYSLSDPGLNTVGYKQALHFLHDEISREQMVKDIKTKTRRYAKRQLTWFRRWDFVNWIDIDANDSFQKVTKKVLQHLAEKPNKSYL